MEVPADDLPSQSSSLNAEVPADDLPVPSGEVPADDLPDDPITAKYETTGQQVLTGVEGLAQGVAGPLATAAELAIGVPAEDIAGRASANPVTHAVGETAGVAGSLLVGTGEAALVGKAAEAASQFAGLGKIGSGLLKGALTNGVLQGGDEVSNWMLGQGDPTHPVGAALAHMGAASLFGGAVGGIGGLASIGAEKGLTALAERKAGDKAASFLAGLGSAASGNSPEVEASLQKAFTKANAFEPVDIAKDTAMPSFDASAYKNGQTFFQKHIGEAFAHLTAGGVGGYEALQGYKENGVSGAAKGALEGVALGYLGKLGTGIIGKAGEKIAAPVILKMLSSGNVKGLVNTLNYAGDVASGNRALDKAISGLFTAGAAGAQGIVKSYGDLKARQKLDRYISGGGINQNLQEQIYQDAAVPQTFAEGGEVKPPPAMVEPVLQQDQGVALHYPAQNIMLNAAKGRISGYLMSLKPQANSPKLAFDDEPDQSEATKNYHKALDIANKPLGVLDEIKRGTIEPEHVAHLNQMYPELTSLMQSKITKDISKAQLDGKKPDYHVRQGLSMLVGAPLSGELTPAAIQAAQSVFAPQAQPAAPTPPPKRKGAKSALSKSSQAFLTDGQARQERMQKS